MPLERLGQNIENILKSVDEPRKGEIGSLRENGLRILPGREHKPERLKDTLGHRDVPVLPGRILPKETTRFAPVMGPVT